MNCSLKICIASWNKIFFGLEKKKNTFSISIHFLWSPHVKEKASIHSIERKRIWRKRRFSVLWPIPIHPWRKCIFQRKNSWWAQKVFPFCVNISDEFARYFLKNIIFTVVWKHFGYCFSNIFDLFKAPLRENSNRVYCLLPRQHSLAGFVHYWLGLLGATLLIMAATRTCSCCSWIPS